MRSGGRLGVAFAAGVVVGASAYHGWRVWIGESTGLAMPHRHPLQNAWAAVRAAPEEAEGWAALGDAQVVLDQAAAAEHSYQIALRLGAHEPSIHGRLGFLLYGRGEDQRALPHLEIAARAGVDLPMLTWTVEHLREKQRARLAAQGGAPTGVPAEPTTVKRRSPEVSESREPEPRVTAAVEKTPTRGQADEESVKLRRDERTRSFLAPVWILGQEIWLVVDTGANVTVLVADAADRLGLEVDHSRPFHAMTAAGPARFAVAYVDGLTIGDQQVRDISVAVCDDCGGAGADGLLGLDILGALHLELRMGTGELVFTVD